MSITENQLSSVMGADVYGSDGDKVGKVGQVFLDDVTGKPEWVTVQTGLFGTKETFVPIESADLDGDRLQVPFSKDKIKDAPGVDADQGHLSPDEERTLYDYYGIGYDTDRSDSGLPAGGLDTRDVDADRDVDVDRDVDADRTSGYDTSGPTTDDAMTRSEERLKVGTETAETGRARLRKYVVTEEQSVTVPVSREEVRVEREPITEANRDQAMAGPDLSEEEHEVVLREERPVVAKETVPVERVSLEKETVTEDRQVTEQVRKEQVDTEGLGSDDSDIESERSRSDRV